MAQLSSLVQFTAGTPAIAADVNQNFTDIRNHINGANIDTENIASTLTSRAGGPILFLDQASQNQIAFAIQNSQTNTAMQILQSAVLADNSKAVLKIQDSGTQTVGKAELWLSLAGGSTIPAILVEHGANTTMSLTKTQLNLFNNVIQASSSGLSLNNINTSGRIIATAPLDNAVALRLAGRSSDNISVLDFTSNNQLIQYASISAYSGGLSLNLPDTADQYVINISGVPKTVIDNNGLDGQYIKNQSIPKNKMVSVGQQTVTPDDYNIIATGSGGVNLAVGPSDIPGSSITIVTTGRPVMLVINATHLTTNNGSSGHKDVRAGIYLLRGSSVLKFWHGGEFAVAASAGGDAGRRDTIVPISAFYLDPVSAGTYTYKLQLWGYTGNAIGGGGVTTSTTSYGVQFTAYEL